MCRNYVDVTGIVKPFNCVDGQAFIKYDKLLFHAGENDPQLTCPKMSPEAEPDDPQLILPCHSNHHTAVLSGRIEFIVNHR